MGEVVVERKVRLRSPRRSVWCLIADTERLNRAIGLGSIEVTPNRDDSAARYVVKTVAGGFEVEYEEQPFEWVEEQRFSIMRVLRRGVAARMHHAFALESLPDGGTEVSIRLEIEPRYALLAPIIRLKTIGIVERMLKELRSADEEIMGGSAACFRTGHSPVDEAYLERAAKALRTAVGSEQLPIAERLVAFVRDASDA